MKRTAIHPTYGEIVYTESFWSGKKTITINGTPALKVSKTEFLIYGEKATLKGNVITGVTLNYKDESIMIVPKASWYEYVLALLPLIFALTWGNIPFLTAILPAVGGALGAGLGAAFMVLSLYFMQKYKSPSSKILVGICVFSCNVLISVILGFLIASVLSLAFAALTQLIQ